MATITPLSPRQSAKYITSRCQNVTINHEGVHNAAKLIYPELKNSLYSVKNWRKHDLHPKQLDESTIDWIFLLDTLNFSFWTENDKPQFVVKYHGQCYTGYWALCAAINRALEDGIPITTPSYYQNITEEKLGHVFSSETSTGIPLLSERVRNLRETGAILTEKYSNSFVNVVNSCNKSASTLLNKITSLFPCFKDEADYLGQPVAFHKRAQILIADIWACFEGASFGEFKDIDSLTMFADYLVPRGLQCLNVLKYSNVLQDMVKSGGQLLYGSLYEVEIRGCSIWAVELICEELRQLLQQEHHMQNGCINEQRVIVNAILVDFFLWDYSKQHEHELNRFPMHKTRSIFY